MPKVIIIGAGLSGISAGFNLIKQNIVVEIFEATNKIGGRVCSFQTKKQAEIIDNGQHLLVPAYKYFFNFCEEIGSSSKFYKQDKLFIPFFQNNEFFFLNSKKLPGKLGLISAFLSLPNVSTTSKLNLIKLFVEIKFRKNLEKYNVLSVRDLLKLFKQDTEIIKKFWEPFVLATMNCSIEQASAKIFINILKEAFIQSKTNFTLIFPATPLSQIVEPFLDGFFNIAKKRIHFNTYVKELIFNNSKVIGIKLKNEEVIEADCYILALPPTELLKIIPENLKNKHPFNELSKIEYSPIISAYFWTSTPLFEYDLICVLNKNIQWIFNKNKNFKRIVLDNNNKISNLPNNYLYSITVSNAKKLINHKIQDIKEIFISELLDIFPNLKESDILNFCIIKEPKATIIINPETEKYRPHQYTPFENLFICGDWTSTELPATIESAVKSGFIASQLAISYLSEK